MGSITTADYLAMLARTQRNPLRDAIPDAAQRETGRGALHDQIEGWLRGKGWFYVHSRTDVPSTNQLGCPDFIVAGPSGKAHWVECKSKTGKLTTAQLGVKLLLEQQGHSWTLVRSLAEFQALFLLLILCVSLAGCVRRSYRQMQPSRDVSSARVDALPVLELAWNYENPSGIIFEVWCSTNLVDWEILGETWNGVWPVRADEPARFFRVRAKNTETGEVSDWATTE